METGSAGVTSTMVDPDAATLGGPGPRTGGRLAPRARRGHPGGGRLGRGRSRGVVAPSGREDLLEAPLLCGVGAPGTVPATGDRRAYGLQAALVHVALERAAGDRTRGPVDGEPLSARAGRA